MVLKKELFYLTLRYNICILLMLIIFVKKNNDKLDRFLKKQLHKNFWQRINNKKATNCNLGGSVGGRLIEQKRQALFVSPFCILSKKEVNTSMKTSNCKPFAIQRIKTKDLWQSAFMLANGSQLQDLRLTEEGQKQVIVFILTGKNVNHLKREFTSGQAMCRVSILKASLMHLKDEMFKIMNSN